MSSKTRNRKAALPPPSKSGKDNGIWIFVGNLTEEISEVELRELFTEFGQVNKIFLNTKLGFASVQMDTLQNAETAIGDLDGLALYGKEIILKLPSQGKSVEINTFSSTSIKVENLSPMVTNELLFKAFSKFGIVKRAVVITGMKAQSTTRGIVEFSSELSAQSAVKQIEEGCYLISTYPKPIEARLMEYEDSINGLPEEKITKTPEYYNEIKVGPRMAVQGTFEEELARTYKVRYQLERKQRQQFEASIAISRRIFEEEMLTCWTKQQQALNIKQEVLSFEEKLEEEKSKKKFEARRRIQMEKQVMEMNQREEDVDETPSKKIVVTTSIPMLTATTSNEKSQIKEITSNNTGVGHKRNLPNHDDKEPREKKRTIKKRRVEKEEVNEEENEGTSSREIALTAINWQSNTGDDNETTKTQDTEEEGNESEETALEEYVEPTEEEKATELFKECGVLPREVYCPKCKSLCRFEEKTERYRCDKTFNGKRCNYLRSVRKGTIMSSCKKMKKNSDFLVFVSKFLAKDFNSDQVARELNWNHTTGDQWSTWCGEVCKYFVQTQEKIGGPDTVVEVNETFMCHRKQQRGKIVHEFWVVVGKERDSDKRFAVNLEETNPRTEGDGLIEIIKKFVLPGGIVITGDCPSYSQLNNHGYTHQVIDGENVVHTQEIKQFCFELQSCPTAVNRGRAPKSMPIIICRCIFVGSFKKEDERLDHFLRNLALLHPPPPY